VNAGKENRCYPVFLCSGTRKCSFFIKDIDNEEECFFRVCERDGEFCNSDSANNDSINEIWDSMNNKDIETTEQSDLYELREAVKQYLLHSDNYDLFDEEVIEQDKCKLKMLAGII